MSYIIQSAGSSNGEALPAGNYNAIFRGVEKFVSKDGDNLLRWKFDSDGKTISDVTGSDSPRVSNRLGKFLCNMANKSLVAGTEVEDPSVYVGRKYFLIVSATAKGNRIEAFSLMA